MNHHHAGTVNPADNITNNAAPPIYPRRYFDLSPTWFAWNILSAADIHALRNERGFEGQQIAFHSNHPIRFVRLVGVIVSIDITPGGGKHALLCLDDGSGACVEVKVERRAIEVNNQEDSRGEVAVTYPSNTLCDCIDVHLELGALSVLVNREVVDIGSVLKVKATLENFRGTRQLKPERVWVVKDTNAESQAWTEAAAWKREKLAKPWVLTTKQMQLFDENLRQQELLEKKKLHDKRLYRVQYDEKRRLHEEKKEARRLKEEKKLNAGALAGSHIIKEPWD